MSYTRQFVVCTLVGELTPLLSSFIYFIKIITHGDYPACPAQLSCLGVVSIDVLNGWMIYKF